MSKQKRVAAIHDISCIGKCSLTVALPILSAAGVECAVMPTAVLSTHTGGFTGYTYRDLTEDLLPIARHWNKEGVAFDALYSGFLGSFEQIDLVREIIEMFRGPETLVLIDPVMADNGKLYTIYSPKMAKGMAGLCSCADIIVPNITEAAFLLEEEYKEGPYTTDYIENILYKLASLGPSKVVLTGVYFDDQQLGAACYDAKNNQIEYAFSTRIPGLYHGTGDVFGSALLSALLNHCTLAQAAQIAVDFTCDAIDRTAKAGTDVRFGVNFEAGLAAFGQQLQE